MEVETGNLNYDELRGRPDPDDELPDPRRRRLASLYSTLGNFLCNLHIPEKLTKKKVLYEECNLEVHVNELVEENATVDFEEEEYEDFDELITKKQAEEADFAELESIKDFKVYEEVPDEGQHFT